jgi:pyruvate dehydrogenase E2 component (dihydrolipoamide acetyltransferase)
VTLEFRLPDVGEGTDSAELVEWHVAVGDAVREDQPLCDIETDKAIVGIPCPTTATVLDLRAEEGDTVAVGAVLAVFGEPGELTAAPPMPAATEPAPPPAGATAGGALPRLEPAAGPAAAEGGAALPRLEPAVGTAAGPAATEGGGALPRADSVAGPAATEGGGALPRADSVAGLVPGEDGGALPGLEPAAAAAAAATAAGRALASPPARRLAANVGVDLASVTGSGPYGAVLPRDLPAEAAADAASLPAGDRRHPLRGLRRTIARTLTAQWQTVPHVTDYREVDASGLLDLRRRLRADAEHRGEKDLAAAITATPILAKLASTLLRRHPLLNAAIDLEREEITIYGSVNIGIATATADGLLVPVIHDADRKTVSEIAVECAALASAARQRTIGARDLADATFTLNNYGALGIWLGTPIIPPRQSANLGIGRIEDRPVVRNGEIVVRPIAALACSGDHRLLDGDVIARFVTDLVRAIEDPLVLFGELR